MTAAATNCSSRHCVRGDQIRCLLAPSKLVKLAPFYPGANKNGKTLPKSPWETSPTRLLMSDFTSHKIPVGYSLMRQRLAKGFKQEDLLRFGRFRRGKLV